MTIVNHNNDHMKNEFGVCTTCAMGMAEEYADCKSKLWTDCSEKQMALKRRFTLERFLELTTPNGHGGR